MKGERKRVKQNHKNIQKYYKLAYRHGSKPSSKAKWTTKPQQTHWPFSSDLGKTKASSTVWESNSCLWSGIPSKVEETSTISQWWRSKGERVASVFTAYLIDWMSCWLWTCWIKYGVMTWLWWSSMYINKTYYANLCTVSRLWNNWLEVKNTGIEKQVIHSSLNGTTTNRFIFLHVIRHFLST